MIIDKTTYNKAARIPYNPKVPCGYQPRPTGRLDIRAIIGHTTNGKIGSTFHQEAEYLANSRKVSAHYLVGKDGRIAQILDPLLYLAYHAGCVKSTAFSNLFSVGIEMHNTPAEGHITVAQQESFWWLVNELRIHFNIQRQYIETHRNVAVYCRDHPLAGRLGRKIDPSGLSDGEFYTKRDMLYLIPPQAVYKVKAASVNVRQSPGIEDNNIAGVLYYGDVFTSSVLKLDENGQYINGVNTWAHVTHGESRGKVVDGLGFVNTSNLILV